MTPEEIQDWRDWSAKLLDKVIGNPAAPRWLQRFTDGWQLVDNWTPDTDLNQCFMLVERMRELGWRMKLRMFPNVEKLTKFECCFYRPGKQYEMQEAVDSPCLSILKAARATEVDEGIML